MAHVWFVVKAIYTVFRTVSSLKGKTTLTFLIFSAENKPQHNFKTNHATLKTQNV